MGKPTRELTRARHAQFVEHYLRLGNASQAYREVYPNAGAAAHVQAAALMKKPHVQEMIAKRRNASLAVAQDATDMDLIEVLKELKALVQSDIRELYDEHGAMKPIKEWPDSLARAVSGVESAEIGQDGAAIGSVKKVKFWDKNAAIEKAMKHLGAFAKDNEQKTAPLPPVFNIVGVMAPERKE